MNTDDKNIDISILVLTYNHVKYVSKALDSILNQKHDLAVEILIVDDASTDGTVEILEQYAKDNPQLITLVCNEMNSCHPTKNVYRLCEMARGRYVAFLEGDDYWIDRYKLQKQFDFLENNVGFCAHTGNIQVVDEKDENIEGTNFYAPLRGNVYTINDFKTLQMPAMAGGVFTRNIFQTLDSSIIYKADRYMGDITVFMLCLLHGDIYQSEEVLSAYRFVCKSGENNFNSINKENKYREYNQLRYWIRLEKYICDNGIKDYEIDIIKDGIARCGQKYSSVAMMKLLKESRKAKYYIIYALTKRNLYSRNNSLVRKVKKKWKDFRKDKAPLIIFGAGELAARYMDAYAWKDDILFLVDNDLRKQNTSFKGYLVKSPTEIKNQKWCKVLITNEKYEKEIEEQLMNMGITNCYCFCSMQLDRYSNRLLRRIHNLWLKRR